MKHRNEGFTCISCKKDIPSHPTSCRNHCCFCLASLHVDEEAPGDRQSTCNGIMKVSRIESDAKKGQILYHQCEICGKVQPNKVAPDDNYDLICSLIAKQNEIRFEDAIEKSVRRPPRSQRRR